MIMTNSFQSVEAVRPLQGVKWLLMMMTKNGIENVNVLTQSLQKGTVPSSRSPSSCTTIPGKGNGGRCPLNGMNFAGLDVNVVHAPPTVLGTNIIIVDSGSTSIVNESDKTQQQNQSS
ncbi:hypothetical protein BVC80_441g29 [Macleaya cordata]|uniref:Uncharacterized protein n=1 Tax=Macleaya cordata TaxID=56857 RepID=A0A200Q492_MACCD|nr:hypothetical protein BVC80_441g29 [Macleaya cordata]